MDEWLDLFEHLLTAARAPGRSAFSAADCVAFPFLKYGAPAGIPPTTSSSTAFSMSTSPVEGRPRLAAWIERVDARPRV